MLLRLRCLSIVGLAAGLGLAHDVEAQEGPGFRFGFGWEQAGGELGNVLGGAVDSEFSLLVPAGPVRVGAGANWASLGVEGRDESWSRIRFHGLAQLPLRLTDGFWPYVEGRAVFHRLRPEDDRFYGSEEENLLRDFAATGWGWEGVAGAQLRLHRRAWLDLSAGWSSSELSPDLSPEGFGQVGAGSAWRLHASVSWFPMADRGFSGGGAGQDRDRGRAVETDAWGQPRNFGLAAAEAFLGNGLPWTFNELVPGRQALLISQISPRSWWRNVEQGWEWDDNAFQVNHFAHPFQGNIYFNSARSNGYGFWTALAFATAGSFHWECCGETHFMSVNDWVNTALGGAAVGEMLYRTSSRILDNRATGTERVLREAAAFVLTPTRSFTRLVTGTAARVYDNPESAWDRRPPGSSSSFVLGMRGADSRRTARGGTLEETLEPHGFFDIELRSGDLGGLERNRPFDYFRLSTQVNFIRGRGLGVLRIRGNLWHRDLTKTEGTDAKLVLMQDFEYENNSAFEQGGQGVSFLYHRESRPWEGDTMAWWAGPSWMILGGVKSELAFAAEVEGIRERFREYDFGIGPGARVGYEWRRNSRPLLEASYRAQFLATLNGSARDGLGSSHTLQILRLRAMLPWRVAGFTLGADYEFFHRRSDFELADIGVVTQNTGIWQTFVSWSP